MKIIFDSKEERKKFICIKVQGCPSDYGLEANCKLSCADCWSNALVGISEIKQDESIPDREEQHENDLIFAKRILKARIICAERSVAGRCGEGYCDDCHLLYESGTNGEMIHAYQIAIQCIEREERLRKWLQAETEKVTTSA